MFTNISLWSRRKLKWIKRGFNTLFFLTSIVAPFLHICVLYDLFKAQQASVGGVFVIILFIFAVLTMKFGAKLIDKMPDSTIKEQRRKYSIQLVFRLIIPAVLLIVMSLSALGIEAVLTPAIICISYYLGGILIDGLFIKYLDKEEFIRQKASDFAEQQKRIQNHVL